MKTKISFLLALIPILCLGQIKYENSYLSMNIPEGWEVQNMNMAGANMELLYFYNSGASVYNMGMVIGIEQKQTPSFMLQSQMDIKTNILFKNAVFGAIRQTTFLGKPAQTVDFDTKIDGVSFKGAAYAFNEGECSILSIGCYKVGVKSNLPQIWSSIQWKQHKRDMNKYTSLREELLAFTDTMNKMWNSTPVISDGVQIVSIELEKNTDYLVYTYKLTEYSKSDFTEEQITNMHDYVRSTIVDVVKAEAEQTELLKRCMDNEYIFKYVYLDKDNNFLYSVKVIPDDYKEK